MNDKLISMEAAVERVPSGCILGLGGLTLYRRPVAFAQALIQHCRQKGGPRDLTLVELTAGYESDLLVGAGMVSRVRSAISAKIFGLAPMFTYAASQAATDRR
jgi:glutaconate CoA-transferase subunit A